MNKTYPYAITDQTVILLKGGRRLIASQAHANFNKIIEAIKSNKFNNIERLFEIKNTVEKCFNVKIVNNKDIFYKDKPLHPVIAEKIMYFLRNRLPYRPLIKFFNNLLENPSQVSRDTLYQYLTDQKLPITEDGSFIGCKAISHDWFDKHSGKVCNKVGKIVEMKREDVSSNPEECAGPGLHLGSADYVRDYGGSNSRYILVKVNPKDVVVVPKKESSTFQKIRVCKYKVIAEIKREDLDFVSDYAPKTHQYTERLKYGPKRDKLGRFAKST